MDRIRQLMDKIDALTVRERGMILLAVLAVIVFVWDMFLMQPLDARQQRLQSQLEMKRAEVQALNIELQQLVSELSEDPNAANRARRETLREELAALEAQVQETTAELVDPAQMPRLLRTVINRTEGVSLASLEGLGVSPLVGGESGSNKGSDGGPAVPEGASAGELATAFRHGMRIRFEGEYLTTLDYLRRLEDLEWGFFWDAIDFEVKEYPASETSIKIYTLSLTRDWIRA